MAIKIHFDNIIYRLQRSGGISNYWKEITSRVANQPGFQIQQTEGSQVTRYFPIFSKSDIFHSSYYRINLSLKTKTVVTVHDFMYEFGFTPTLGKAINVQQIRQAIKAADAIICVSENTKKDLLSLYPKLVNNPYIYVISHGTSFRPASREKIHSFGLDRINELINQKCDRYILYIGRRTVYKNFQSALLAFSESSLPKTGYIMVCVGSKFSVSEEKLISSLSLQQKIIVINNANHKELQHLYQHAFALVYPSLYEGFGLPPLEAMSCGCPTIAANNSSLPEVVGDAGILVDAKDISAISNALEQLLDSNLRNTYITKGLARAKLFSWDKAAEKHIKIYQALMQI